MSGKRPAVFLDRDGVLNVDRGYVHRPEDFEWNLGAIDAVRAINTAGYLAVVVTNQSGIARQYYKEEDFRTLTQWMNSELAANGARLDAVYHCPHHAEGSDPKFALDCDCRKPKPGLLLRAIADLDIDPERSFLIGDSRVFEQALSVCGQYATLNHIAGPEALADREGFIDVMHQDTADPATLQMGKVQALGGRAAYAAIRASIELAMANRIAGVARSLASSSPCPYTCSRCRIWPTSSRVRPESTSCVTSTYAIC